MKHISLDAGNSPVSVVGAACRLPGGISTPQDYWQFLESGRRLTASPPGPTGFPLLRLPAHQGRRPPITCPALICSMQSISAFPPRSHADGPAAQTVSRIGHIRA